MKPDRLAEIEAHEKEYYPHAWVHDEIIALCQALREAWTEIERYKQLWKQSEAMIAGLVDLDPPDVWQEDKS